MTTNWPKVVITDETLRDGLQIEREGISIEEKLELLDLLVDAGLRRLVVGAFVNPKWSPQMGDTPELVSRLKPRDGVEFLAIALNERGLRMAEDMSPPLAPRDVPATHLHLCETFMLRNTNRLPADQEKGWRLPVEQAVQRGATQAAIGLSAPWGSNWSGGFSHARRMEALRRQWDAWQAAGIEVTRIDYADPMSWNRPDAIAEDLLGVKKHFPTIRQFHLHMHNARGLAPLSAWEALRVLDSTDTLMLDSAVGGIGGCPYCGNGQATGMIATEDLVQLLDVLGIESGIDIARLIEAAHHLARLLGRPLDGRVYKNGPLPSGDTLYSPDLPVLYTFDEAQHFRLGMSVVRNTSRPWLKRVEDAKREAGGS